MPHKALRWLHFFPFSMSSFVPRVKVVTCFLPGLKRFDGHARKYTLYMYVEVLQVFELEIHCAYVRWCRNLTVGKDMLNGKHCWILILHDSNLQ